MKKKEIKEKKEQPKKAPILPALKKAFGYMRRYRGLVIFAMVLSGLSAFLTLVGPNRIGNMTDLMKEGLTGDVNMAAVGRIGFTLVAIYGAGALFGFLEQYIMASITLKTSKQMRKDLAEKINRVPLSYMNTTTQGDVLSRLTNDVGTLQQGLSSSLATIISSLIQFFGSIALMFSTQWILALCVIFVTVFGSTGLIGIIGKSQKYFKSRQESIGELNGYIEEMYTGHSVVRLSRAEDKIRRRFGELNDAVYIANWKSQFLSGVMQPIMSIVGNLGYVVVCVVGAALAIRGKIPFGTIVAFILFCRLFSSPLTQMAQSITNLQSIAAASDRVFGFLEAEELSDESGKTQRLDTVRGAVEFDHVSFSYPDTPDKTIIHDFSARVEPGQKVAIVGPTGAGKTTMVNLLMRFYEVKGGEIRIDGIPETELTRENIHSLFGMVLQDTWLFEGTVRENLVYNMENVTEADLERVCAVCGIAHFVHSLPEGFDTVLSESTAISAGQKQLLTIARAMLQDSPMLILDEATSSVDTRTEVLIQHAMDELTKGRTSFVIAHRLSTIRNADLILVMKDGDVIESGNHDALMAQGGFYAELYNSQFEREDAAG